MRVPVARTNPDKGPGSKVRRRAVRQGATTVEFAVVAPATFILLLGIVVGGMGVFRYQEVAHLAAKPRATPRLTADNISWTANPPQRAFLQSLPNRIFKPTWRARRLRSIPPN